MWKNDEIIQVFADAYHEAALANAEMRNATEALEAIRSALLERQDSFRVWDKIDEQIGQAEVNCLQPVLITLRNRFERQLFKSEIARLHEVFRQDPQTGWIDWLRKYAEALSFWRLRFCSALAEESFPFKPPTDQEAEMVRRSTRLVLHERWPETCQLFVYLGEQALIPNELRAKFHVTVAEILLYYLMKADKAAEHLRRAKELGPHEARVLYGWGVYWLEQKETERAKDYFQSAIEADPHLEVAYASMGDCYERQEDLHAAEEWYQQTLKIASGNSIGYLRLMRHYGEPDSFLKHKEKILSLVRRAIAVAPEDEYSIYLEIGYIYQKNKEYKEAHQWFDKAIKLDTSRLSGYINRGYAYIQEEKYDQALIAFQKAIEVAPETFDGYWGMSLIHERLGNLEEALHWYEESLRRRQEWEGTIRGNIGSIKWKLGKHDEALKELVDALQLEPGNETLTSHLLRFAIDLYQTLDDEDGALRLYADMRRIKGESYEANYQNLVGNVKYYFGKYEEAVDAYDKAIKANPKEAVYHSNLADAWEKLEIPGKRVNAIENAVSALKRARDRDPKNIQYQERLENLQRKKSIITSFGEKYLDLPLTVTPIAIEVAGDLLPYVVRSEDGELSSKIVTILDDMRKRILEELGVRIPGVKFRHDETLQNGTYVVKLMEIPVVEERISVEKKLFPGSWSKLSQLQINAEQAVNPRTGDEACWVLEKDWKNLESARLGLWDVIEYPIRHLEAILRKNLREFVSYQEVDNRVSASSTDVCRQILDSSESFTSLVQVLKALVSEEVPITAFEHICEKFASLYDAKMHVTTIAERLRSLPDICKNLPGNNDRFSFYQLGQRLETFIQQSFQVEGNQPILSMRPEDCKNVLTTVREEVGSQRNIALLVEKAELRPLLRKLIELEFPQIPVLSQQELLPELEGRVIGEIELEKTR